jgi:large subunit ribosomal protein L23
VRSPAEIILRPLISEKSYTNMQQGKYTFVVHPSANKVEIKRAVEEHWGVKVLSVNTLNVIGKERRRRNSSGFDPSRKKAIVTLAPGEQIKDLFETTSG